jgi:hypothetical protein
MKRDSERELKLFNIFMKLYEQRERQKKYIEIGILLALLALSAAITVLIVFLWTIK